MKEREVTATLSQIVDGPVPAPDRLYSFDMLREICRHAPRHVYGVRARLSAAPDGGANAPAVAQAILVLDGGLLICAGWVGATMAAAVDGLGQRLRNRLDNVAARDAVQVCSRPASRRLRVTTPEARLPVADRLDRLST
jgi:hypothetical protein